MEFESKVIREFVQDYKVLANHVKKLKHLSEPCMQNNREKVLKTICHQLIQNCEFEEKVIHEYMRSRNEDEFQLMVTINEKYHENISSTIQEIRDANYSVTLFPATTKHLAHEVEDHLNNVQKQIFCCLNYYLNKDSDYKLLNRYFTELCKKSISDTIDREK